MDIGLVYGFLTAATAIASGFAGAKSAHLSREAASDTGIDHPTSEAGVGVGAIGRMQRGMREAILERCTGAQNAAAWLATSTALFGVASTRPVYDALGVGFVLIAVTLVVVAIAAMLNATSAAKLPLARAAFEKWYLVWSHERLSTAEKPTEDQIADAFTKENPTFASTMRRFYIWPFAMTYVRQPIRETLPLSERPPGVL